MGIMWYVGCSLLIVIGIIQFIMLIWRNYKKGKNDVLDEMFNNGDIDKKIYLKYKNK